METQGLQGLHRDYRVYVYTHIYISNIERVRGCLEQTNCRFGIINRKHWLAC